MRTYSRQKDTWGDADCSIESFAYSNHGNISMHALCEYDSLTTSSTEDTTATTKGAATRL